MFHDPPERLFLPEEAGFPSTSRPCADAKWMEYRIWEGYIDASAILIREMLRARALSANLIFPALFNLRHGIEVALKWHIRYAGGTVARTMGHDLVKLIDAFRRTADGLSDDATYICDHMLGMMAEMSAIDPRSTAFRYATEWDGSPIVVPTARWDLRRLSYSVDLLSIWLDHLSGYIDMSSDDYEAMMRDMDDDRRSMAD